MTNPIRPANLGGRLSPRYRVSPTLRFSTALAEQTAVEGGYAETILNVGRQTMQANTRSTANLTPVLQIKELKYPGHAADTASIFGKWIYVFDARDKVCVIEGYGVNAPYSSDGHDEACEINYRRGIIDRTTMLGTQTYPHTGQDQVELPEGQLGVGGGNGAPQYHCFLTPYRLSVEDFDQIIATLSDSDAMDVERSPLTAVIWSTPAEAVCWPPDPIQWADDCAAKLYLPTVERWERYCTEPTRQGKVLVCKSLIGWLDQGLTNIENNISGGRAAVNRWLQRYERRHDRLRNFCFVARNYLDRCLDSPEHRLAESSVIAHQDGIVYMTDHWAFVLEQVNAVHPGLKYACNLVRDQSRTPYKILFEHGDTHWNVNAGATRYMYIAAREVFLNLLPAKIRIEAILHGQQAAAASPAWQARWNHLKTQVGEHIIRLYNRNHIRPGWQVRTIAREIGVRNPPYGPVPQARAIDELGRSGPRGRMRRVEREFERILVELGESTDNLPRSVDVDPAAARRAAQQSMESSRKLHFFEGRSAKATICLGGTATLLAEAWNFSMALEAYADAEKDEHSVSFYGFEMRRSTLGMIGASTDLAGEIASFREAFVTTWNNTHPERAIPSAGLASTRVIAALGFISGVCEMLEHEASAVDAWAGRGNHAQAIAYGAAAFGGAMGAFGAGLVVASTWMGASSLGGPVGIVIGIVGAVLIFAGYAIAAFLSRTPYEQFAEYCFLGDSRDSDQTYYLDWAPYGMPTADMSKEVRAAMTLHSAFLIEREGRGHIGNYLTTQPPHLVAALTFQYLSESPVVDIQIYLQGTSGGEHKANYRINGHDGVATLRGGSNLIPVEHPVIEKGEDGRIRRVLVNVRPAWIWRAGSAIRPPRHGDISSIRIRARVRNSAFIMAPANHDYADFDFSDRDDGEKMFSTEQVITMPAETG